MDSKGAQELARLLEERHGVMPAAEPAAPISDAEAAPIFHWFGVEPGTESQDGVVRRWGRLGRRRRPKR